MDKRTLVVNKKEIDIIEQLGYHTLAKLGLGGYGTVFLVEKGGKESVIKIAKSKISKEINKAEIREAILLKQFKSPYIISIGDVSLNVKESFIVIELEKMDNPFSSIEQTKQSVNFYKNMIYSVVQALFYMHTRGYVHNDIKPENILLKGNTVKLADFGLCNYLGIPISTRLREYCGTDYFKAPDSLGDSIYIDKNRYNYNSDMYSLGSLMYWIVMGTNFKKKQTEAINLLTEEYRLKRGVFIEYYGEEGVIFMERCLERDTEKRMNSKQALEDPYLKNYKGGKVSKFIKENYPEVDIYVTDYVNYFYENYKDVKVMFRKIRNGDEYIRLVEQVLEYVIKYNKSLESFIQYILLFRKAIVDFSEKKLDELSICCFSITNKLYEDTACNVMIKRLLKDIPHKTSEELLIKLELDILNRYGFNVPLVPIYSMMYYYSVIDKIDINRSFQSAIRLLLSTEIEGESTLDELVKFVIKPIKGNKLERVKEDGRRRNLKDLNSIEIEMEEMEESSEEPNTPLQHSISSSKLESNSEVEVDECVIDGIGYLKDDNDHIYNPETHDVVGKYNWKDKKWIVYKENIFTVYENAMSLYERGDHIYMVRYLENHIDMFSDKKYLNLRRLILEKAKAI